MKIGYACIPVASRYKTNRRFALKNFSCDKFYSTTKENLQDLILLLKYNIANDIYFFRISSDIIPFGSHEINNIRWWEIFKEELDLIGRYIKDNCIRVSMHPGQYTVMNSPTTEVVEKSIAEIEYHTKFLDSLGIDYSNKIIVHIGGEYGDKTSAIKRFSENIKVLSDSARGRLILENDEKIFNIEDVLEICNKNSLPAVFDNLHHKFNPSLGNDIDLIFKEVFATWKEKDGIPKVHYSDSDKYKRSGAHSPFVYTENFIDYLDKIEMYNVDIMLEVKDKDISAIKCVNLLKVLGKDMGKKSVSIYEQWSKYKYLVMEKNYALYKECSNIVNKENDLIKLYKTIDRCLDMEFNGGNFINAAEHVWGYFKKASSEKEKQKIKDLINKPEEYIKIKEYLRKLAIKYNEKYLLDSYYFYY